MEYILHGYHSTQNLTAGARERRQHKRVGGLELDERLTSAFLSELRVVVACLHHDIAHANISAFLTLCQTSACAITMASTTSTDKGTGPVQPANGSGGRRFNGPEQHMTQRQASLSSSQTVHSARLQSGWDPGHPYAGTGQQQMGQQQLNATYLPNAQTIWPPGALPYLQPQLYMYPGLPGSPSALFPGGTLHPAQRSVPQMPLGMMVAGQQYPMNSMLPFNMAPAPTQEAWLQARNLRPQPGMVQGIRPTGWGGIPIQSPQQAQQAQQNPHWQQSQRQEPANTASRRPERMQAQPPPPPPRASSMPHTAQMHKDLAPAGLLPASIDSPTTGRASSLPHMDQQQQAQQQHIQQQQQAVQQQPQQQLAQSNHAAYPAAAAATPSGKVPCAFFLKTGTCAYGDKCKFEHPWDKLPVVRFNSIGLPLRPGQPECAYYLRHARCGFGPSCKFHHPEPGTSGGPQDFQPDPQPAPTSLLGGPQSDPSISYTATGIPAPATATGIPASAVTGIPVSTMGVDVPATSMQDVAQGVPVPEAGLHADQAKNLPAQADASLSQPQFIISSSPPQPLTQSAATLLQPASVAYPGMHMTAAVPTLPVTALQLAALQQPQGQVPSVSVPLQAAVVTAAQSSAVPSVSASAEEAQHAQKAQHAQQTQQEAQQTQQAQQAQQSQQAQQGLQQQSTVLAPSAPMQSWPQSANIAAAPTAMYAQAGTMPVLQASTAVAGAQLPAQQLASNGVQQPTAVPSPQLPVQQVEPIAVQPASTIMASGPQVMYGSQPAQVAQAAPSNGMLEVPTGVMQPTSAPATQYIQHAQYQLPMQQQQQQQQVQVPGQQQQQQQQQQQVPIQQQHASIPQLHVPAQVSVQVPMPSPLPLQAQVLTHPPVFAQPQVPVQQQLPFQHPYQQQVYLQQPQMQPPEAVRPPQGIVAPSAAIASQTLVAANPGLAAAQPIPLVVSPAYQALTPSGVMQATSMAGIPLRAPTIPVMPAISPAASKDIGQPNFEELTASLPDLHLNPGKGSSDDKGMLDSAPSISTPLPSEASLATASTTSNISGGTLLIDAAKAIETVRHSLEDRSSGSADQRSKSSASGGTEAGGSRH